MTPLKMMGIATLIFFTTAAATQVIAGPPHFPDLVREGNRWTITAYDDTSPTQTQLATQGLCFYPAGVQGTHQLYYWVSDTFPDWNGLATQEGDQIFMYGDYAEDVGHDGMQWEIMTNSKTNEGAGHWHEWRENGKFGNTIGWANARLERVGKCDIDTPEEALEVYRNIDFSIDDKGNLITLPMGHPDLQFKE